LPRSSGCENVVVSSDRAAGASAAPNAPWAARGDEHREALRRASDSGRHGEARHADQEQPLAPEDVSEAAAEQQQAAERQRVGRDDPLPVRGREMQRGLGVRQGDAHDRRVEGNHQLRGGQDGKDPPPAGRLAGRERGLGAGQHHASSRSTGSAAAGVAPGAGRVFSLTL
jgi:hypothetical protein